MGDFTKDVAVIIANETRPGHEDEVTNYPTDPGGVTKYGIAKSAHPNVDVAGLTLEAAEEIYRAEYWAKVDGDALGDPLALNVFDAAVNLGPPVARALLEQRRTGNPAVDPYLWARVEHYARICLRKDGTVNPRMAVNLPGWILRACKMRRLG